MKQLLLRELLLVSRKEKKARRLKFNRDVTVIKGDNDVGKSSVIKSIYGSLGALPTVHDRWADADVKSLLTFSVDETIFHILRDGDVFTVYDNDRKPVGRHRSISTELGPYLASILDFRLTLMSRNGDPVVPPPAFLFLPYYVDQDISWHKNWAAFQRLQQFARWKKDVVEYHIGIRPNEFYAAKGKMRSCQEAMQEPRQKYAMLRDILRDLDKRIESVDFSIDLDSYQEELQELLVACEKLRKEEQKYKEQLVKAHNVKTTIETQLHIATHARNEIRKDFTFASEQLVNQDVECPICGASYDNDFADRFSIARDEDRCEELLAELSEELAAINGSIREIDARYAEKKLQSEQITTLLARKKEEVQLRDVIESEGRKQVRGILVKNSVAINEELQRLHGQIEDLKAIMKSYDDRDRRKVISEKYLKCMRAFLRELEVHALPEKSFNKVDSTIRETGSDLPRALLAYYFSILCVMNEHSSSARCPIVIDAPNQQDQDIPNLKKMLEFISQHRPQGAQVVLGLVDDCGVDFGGDVIEFKEKLSVLSSDQFDEAMAELTPMLDASVSIV